MIKVEELTVTTDNTIVINGVTFMVTDAVAGTVLKLCKGEKINSVLKEQKKTDSNKFPPLGQSTEIVGNVTIYADSLLVRYWEVGYLPYGAKEAIKKTIYEAGAVWDKSMGAYKFPNKTALNKWVKAQREYQAKRKAA